MRDEVTEPKGQEPQKHFDFDSKRPVTEDKKKKYILEIILIQFKNVM